MRMKEEEKEFFYIYFLYKFIYNLYIWYNLYDF